MSTIRRRIDKLEARQTPERGFEHVRLDNGWIAICRNGKAIIAMPDNGRGVANA
jgi:hypothetical protein